MPTQSINALISRAKFDLSIALSDEATAQEMLQNATNKRSRLEQFLAQLQSYSDSTPKTQDHRSYKPITVGKGLAISNRVLSSLRAAKGKPLSVKDLFNLLEASPENSLIITKEDTPAKRRASFSSYISRMIYSTNPPITRRSDGTIILANSASHQQEL